MTYELGRLSSDEFEDLAADIVALHENSHVEVYKAGKDQGIDGKFRTWNNGKGIIQAKHWVKTSLAKLLTQIKNEEVEKAKKLKADKYLFFISKELSHLDKNKIMQSFDGCIKGTEDIFGYHDIERFLKSNPEIERKHFKLWLSSTNVMQSIFKSDILGESDFTLQEIYKESEIYVALSSHKVAFDKLIGKRVLIITGAPGNGKTTLAKNICLQFVGDGYQLINVGSNLSKASSFLDKNNKVIFYFDDFLGRNYCEAISDKEDSEIIRFMKRVQLTDNCYLILTSRSNILTRRKFEVEEYKIRKIYKNEFELNIQEMPLVDKAKVLLSHMYHSKLNDDFIKSILKNRFYRTIVSHKNFNPRIIEYIFDIDRVANESVTSINYPLYIKSRLDNPSEIWDVCFKKQAYVLKIIILGISYSGRGIYHFDEESLRLFYDTIKILDPNVESQQQFDCLTDCLKSLTGSMISRNIDEVTGIAHYDVNNPSINDYIYKKYFFEYDIVAKILASHDSNNPLLSFSMQYRTKKNSGLIIVNKVIDYIKQYSLKKSDTYLMYLMDLKFEFSDKNCNDEEFILWFRNFDYIDFTPRKVTLFLKNLDRVESYYPSVINAEVHFDFLIRCLSNCSEFSDIEAIVKRIKTVDLNILNRQEKFENRLAPIIEAVLCEDIESRVESDSILSDLLPHDESESEDVIYYYVEELIEGLGFSQLSLDVDIESIISNVDILSILEANMEDESGYRFRMSNDSPTSSSSDGIDEIFENFERPES